MADEHRVDWRTYTEARADFDKAMDALEKRLRETIEAFEKRLRESEDRIIRRLDDQQRSFERVMDHYREGSGKHDERLRALEQDLATLKSQGLAAALEHLSREVTVLKTTNRILAALLGLSVTVVELLRK